MPFLTEGCPSLVYGWRTAISWDHYRSHSSWVNTSGNDQIFGDWWHDPMLVTSTISSIAWLWSLRCQNNFTLLFRLLCIVCCILWILGYFLAGLVGMICSQLLRCSVYLRVSSSVGPGHGESLVMTCVACWAASAGACTASFAASSTVLDDLLSCRADLVLRSCQHWGRCNLAAFLGDGSLMVDLIRSCSLLNWWDVVEVWKDHRGDEIVLAALVGLVQAAWKWDVVRWLRVRVRGAVAVYYLRDSSLTYTLCVHRL